MSQVTEFENLGLHHVAEMEASESGGWYLRRLPKDVRESLSPLGRMVAMESAGVELRLVTDSPNFRVSISSLPTVLSPYEHHNQDVFIFRGAFFHSHHRLTPGRINHLNIVNIPGTENFDSINPSDRHQCGFSHRVWRVFLGRFPAILHSVDTYGFPCRPPQEDEVPVRRMIAYGSSITNGASPTVHHNAYIYHAASMAGLDVCNLGLSGSCLCEPQMAEYLSKRSDWHIMLLELGVNMRINFTPEQFQQRASQMINQICQAHPDKKVLLTTIYPNAASDQLTQTPQSPYTLNQQAFNNILRDIVSKHIHHNLFIVEGSDILDDPSLLTVDLIHPSDYGHARMGMNLGQYLNAMNDKPLHIKHTKLHKSLEVTV